MIIISISIYVFIWKKNKYEGSVNAKSTEFIVITLRMSSFK